MSNTAARFDIKNRLEVWATRVERYITKGYLNPEESRLALNASASLRELATCIRKNK